MWQTPCTRYIPNRYTIREHRRHGRIKVDSSTASVTRALQRGCVTSAFTEMVKVRYCYSTNHGYVGSTRYRMSIPKNTWLHCDRKIILIFYMAICLICGIRAYTDKCLDWPGSLRWNFKIFIAIEISFWQTIFKRVCPIICNCSQLG